MRICFIGDSFVNGTGDNDSLGWVGRIGAAARQRGQDLTTYNLGVRRDTSSDIFSRWQQEARLRLPDSCDGRLVFSFGTNDCCLGDDGDIRVSLSHSLANAQSILSGARAWRPTLMIGPLPVSDNAAADVRISELSEAFGNLCSGLGVPYLEVFSAIASNQAWKREAARCDGTHPNTEGYAALANLIGDWTAWRNWFAA